MNRSVIIVEHAGALRECIEIFCDIWGLAASSALCCSSRAAGSIDLRLWGALIGSTALALATGAGSARGRYAIKACLVADRLLAGNGNTYQFDPDDPVQHVRMLEDEGPRDSRQRSSVQVSLLVDRGRQHKPDPSRLWRSLPTEVVRDAWRYYYVLVDWALGSGGTVNRWAGIQWMGLTGGTG